MSDRANLVRVLTASTGTSTMTLGAAYSSLFMTSAEANMADGHTYTYLIVDGTNWEMGKGVYTAFGTTLSRVTVLASRIAGTLGTTHITLSGTAQVRVIESADDMDAIRGTRVVTGTTDTLMQTDLGHAVVYSSASAVAVSLAQAGAASQFLDGWCVWVQNTGAGTVTITPATSTVNGGATLVLSANLGAFIWSDGTNYNAYYHPTTKPLLAANNLSDVANAATALGNLGGVSYGTAQTLTAAQQGQALANLGGVALRIVELSASGNFTTPANITTSTVFKITLVGGGNTGGGSAVNTVGGGGGAGGAVSFWIAGLSPSTAYAVTIGNNTGGTTSIVINSVTYSVTGGAAGGASATTNVTAAQGAPNASVVSGGAVLGYVTYSQNVGQGQFVTGTSVYIGCPGGGTLFGSGGQAGMTGSGSGQLASGYGAGGGGGVGAGGGGAGTPGLFIAEWVG